MLGEKIENPPSPGHAAITISTCKLPRSPIAPGALDSVRLAVSDTPNSVIGTREN